MQAHRVSIDRLATRVRIGAGDPIRAQGRLQPVLTELMPRAFAAATGRLLQDRNDVIRIRKLMLRIVDPQAAEGSALAGLMSSALTDALTRVLNEQPRETVRIWPDRAAYCASFALWRMGLSKEPDWAFPDFTAYTTLTSSQAAMAVLVGSGAAGLLALAGQLRSLGLTAVDVLLRLGPGDSSALLDDCQPLQVSIEDESVMSTALIRVVAAWFRTPLKTAPVDRALAALLDLLIDTDDAGPSTIAEVSVLALTALALAAISEAQFYEPAAGKLRSRLIAGKVPAGPSTGTAQFALRHLLSYRTLRKPLADFTGGTHVEPPTSEKSDKPAANQPRTATGSDVISSRVAGFALLLPLIQRLQLDRVGPPETLRAIAHTVLGLAATDFDFQDPGLTVLMPADPQRDPIFPEILPTEDQWCATGSLGGEVRRSSASPQDIWSDLWLATFAGQLPGLQNSTAGYLRRQFLHRAGTIRIDSKHITVTLIEPPLGIVIRMAGLLGSRGVISHLGNRNLIIAMEPEQ